MKKSLYQILIELSDSHCRFKKKNKRGGYADLLRFDLDSKTIRNNKTILMKNGKVTLSKIELADGREYDLTDVCFFDKYDYTLLTNIGGSKDSYSIIEGLYANYKNSVPSKHSQYSRLNFKALKVDDLSMEQLLKNMSRIKAQYMLEGYILLASIEGAIVWKNDSHFFWQSSKDKDLILFKEWIIN